MEEYIIVNVRNVDTHNCYRGWYLPERDRPTLVHWDKIRAENELVRLQKKYPDGEFVMFKRVAIMKRIEHDVYLMEEQK